MNAYSVKRIHPFFFLFVKHSNQSSNETTDGKILLQTMEFQFSNDKNQSTNFSSIFYENNKSQEIATKLFEQFFEHPEKFTEINLEYIHNLQQLITSSVAKFTGKQYEDFSIYRFAFCRQRIGDHCMQQRFV